MYLWLCLADMKEHEKVQFLNAPVSQTGLFGDAVESFAQQFSAEQKQTEAIKHIMCRRKPVASTPAAAPPTGPCVPPQMSVALLVPLAWSLGAWLALPSPSRWLLRTIRLARRPPKFTGIQFTSVKAVDAPGKGCDRAGPSSRYEVWVLQPLLHCAQENGGLPPILDLRFLNRALHKPPFRMLTQKRIFECIRPQDWFVAINLKDAYFHVSILP